MTQYDLFRARDACVQGLCYIATSIFMIITYKCAITLSSRVWPPVFSWCQNKTIWSQLSEQEKKNFSTFMLKNIQLQANSEKL